MNLKTPIINLSIIATLIVLAQCSAPSPEVVPADESGLIQEYLCDAEHVSGKSFINNSFEFTNGQTQSDDFAHSGAHSCKITNEVSFSMTLRLNNVQKGNYIEVSVWRYSPSGKGKLHVSSDQVGSLHYLVGSPLKVEKSGWQKIVINVPILEEIDILVISCYNPNDEPVYFDDLSVKHYESRPFYYDKSEALTLSIDDQELSTLEGFRKKALETGIIAKEYKAYVPATITYKGEVIPVKLRFKGDWTDHLEGDKWSFRIKVGDGHSFKGLKSFSIQSPHTRSFLQEWFMHRLFENEGLLTTRYDFIPVMFNGNNLGLFAIEEHFDKQLLESRQRREGPILKMDEEGFWERNLAAKNKQPVYNAPYYEAAAILPFKKNRTTKNKSLKTKFLIAQNLLLNYKTYQQNIEDVFNVKSLAQYHALLDIGQIHHGQVWHNQRIYYNPVTSRLEPIAYDLCAELKQSEYRTPIAGAAALHGNDNIIGFRYLNYSVYHQPAFQKEYVKYLKKYSSTAFLNAQIDKLKGELDSLNELISEEFNGYLFDPTVILKNATDIRESLVQYEIEVNAGALHFEKPESKFADLSDKPVYYKETGLKAFLTSQDSVSSVVKCVSFHLAPLDLIGYSIKGAKDSLIKFIVPKRLGAFQISNSTAEFEVTGRVSRLFFEVSNIADSMFNKKVVEWACPALEITRKQLERPLSAFAKYIAVSDSVITLNSNLTLNEVLFIPSGYKLVIKPGSNIRFDEGGGIISYSPISSVGLKNKPINISGKSPANFGVQILTDGEESSFSYTNFKGLSTLDFKGWTLTGALTVYKAKVTIDHCHFDSNHCEDALNLINCDFNLTNCKITSTFGDGFDADFCVGTVDNTIIENAGNDALDFSGSNISVTNSTIIAPGDKGVSGGEASQVIVSNCKISEAPLGVVAKDNSVINIEQVNFSSCNVVYSAYQKKDEFGPANIDSKDCTINSCKMIQLIGLGSTLTQDGVSIIGEKKINVDSLYVQFK
ncbi:MAG: hypothetical protein ACI9J3_002044 [Parvicellaceae bacterium]|jgi:hypothetical protein